MTSNPTASSPDLGETHALMKTQSPMIQALVPGWKSLRAQQRREDEGFARSVCRGSARDVLSHPVEDVAGHDRAFPADRIGIEPDDAIEAEL